MWPLQGAGEKGPAPGQTLASVEGRWHLCHSGGEARGDT